MARMHLIACLFLVIYTDSQGPLSKLTASTALILLGFQMYQTLRF